jgi:hypothetical protein
MQPYPRLLTLGLSLSLALLVSCSAQRVTYQGTDVPPGIYHTTALSASQAETIAVSIAQYLLDGYHNNEGIPKVVVEAYANQVGPAIHASLVRTRELLIFAQEVPRPDTDAALLAELQTLQLALGQAIAMAREYGW